MTLCMLSIIIPTAIESVIIDWLLEQDDINGFNSIALYGHGSHESGMSISERVTGKSAKVMFQTHVGEADAHNILGRLKKQFARSDIHYMIRPMIDAGNLMSYEEK
jgi:uncharacterized protein DUF3240